MNEWAQWTARYDLGGDGHIRLIFGLELDGTHLEMSVRPKDAAANANATRALAERLELLESQRDVLADKVGAGAADAWLVEMLDALPDWTMSQLSDPPPV